MRRTLFLMAALSGACASSSSDEVDAAIDGSTADARPVFDAAVPPDAMVDAAPPDACIVGTPQSCEACGVACPGLGASTANVDCGSGMMCTFSCKGENYDVDDSAGNGCEIADSPTGNHTQNSAVYLGSKPCGDGDSSMTINGRILSDTRVHENPAVTGFGLITGSTRDWYRVFATGGTFCVNDADATLTISGSANPSCYRLSVQTNKGTQTCSPTTGASCSIDQGSGSYDGDTSVYYTIEKTCSAATLTERANYTVSAHL